MVFVGVLEFEYINFLIVLKSGSECKYFTLWGKQEKSVKEGRGSHDCLAHLCQLDADNRELIVSEDVPN